MKTNFKRREFLNVCYTAGLASCGLMMSSRLGATFAFTDEKPDPKKLNYCGYQSPPDCKVKKATVENNLELKKEAFVQWRIEQKYGMNFDAKNVLLGMQNAR